jgi:mRNA interferase MazF
MEKFVKGDVVVIPFPFSDLSNYKKRPALVIANSFGEDIILAQITRSINLNNFSIKI